MTSKLTIVALTILLQNMHRRDSEVSVRQTKTVLVFEFTPLCTVAVQQSVNIFCCTMYTRNSPGDDRANLNFFYDDIFNHFYAVRPGSHQIR